MKNVFKTFMILLVSLIVVPFTVNAATTTYEDLPNGSYVIGKHIFTREGGALTVKKIMLASRTIEADNMEDMHIIYKDIMGNLKEVSNGKDADTNQYPDAEVQLTDVINYEYYDLVKMIYTDGVIASAPNLGELVPIKHNGETWEYADTYEEWYNYADSEWANAVVLADGIEKTVGDPIDEDEIDLWFVWLPRYEYKLPAESIGTTETPNAIDINFISSSKTTPTEGYSFHPGFAWDEDWSDGISEWKDGIWIGKFESTANVTGGENANVLQTIKIKADTTPWRNVQISNMYTSALDIDSTYSLSGMDSHMTRYTEWTAISYLSNSIYGLCTDETTCTEIALNILDEYVDSVDYADDNSYLTGGGDYKTNVAQSTTGNIYGIYDMNGGAVEYVMGYLDEAENLYTYSGFTDSTITTSHKYSDIFESIDNTDYTYASLSNVNGTTSMNGIFKELMTDATYEGYMTWYGDAAYSVASEYPLFLVGRPWDYGSGSGAFASSGGVGGAFPVFGFRVVLS